MNSLASTGPTESKPPALGTIPVDAALALPPRVADGSAPGVFRHTTKYEVSLFPVHSENHNNYAINVDYQDGGVWTADDGQGKYLDKDGNWNNFDMNNQVEWWDRHGHSRAIAIHLANTAAPAMSWMGVTALEVWKAEQR